MYIPQETGSSGTLSGRDSLQTGFLSGTAPASSVAELHGSQEHAVQQQIAHQAPLALGAWGSGGVKVAAVQGCKCRVLLQGNTQRISCTEWETCLSWVCACLIKAYWTNISDLILWTFVLLHTLLKFSCSSFSAPFFVLIAFASWTLKSNCFSSWSL